MSENKSTNFIHQIIDKDNEEGVYGNKVYTRFPPEPIFISVMQSQSVLILQLHRNTAERRICVTMIPTL